MTTVLRRGVRDRGVRLAVLALAAALLLSFQPLPTADAHTRTYCGHGWSGQHLDNGTIWDIQYRSYTNWRNPHIHSTLHYWVFVSAWTGVVYSPDHYRSYSCANH